MPSYTVKTFGCQMNVHDSERIDETLRDAGYALAADAAQADLIVINTCSVREIGRASCRERVFVGV